LDGIAYNVVFTISLLEMTGGNVNR
jgi:hypothetical protein